MSTQTTNELALLRAEIDRIDKELVALFSSRMHLCAAVADYKRRTGMAVTDPTREQELLDRVATLSPTETRECTKELYQTILSLSRSYQTALLNQSTPETE